MSRSNIAHILASIALVAMGLFVYGVWRIFGAWVGVPFLILSVLTIVLSRNLLNQSPDLETRLKVWDAILKSVTSVLLIVTAIVGVAQYLSQRQQLILQNQREQERREKEREQLLEQNKREQEQRAKEYNSMIYRARLDLYQEATDALARFAYAPSTAEAEKASRRFWELFDGKFSIVEDEGVQREMRLCVDFLEEWERCKYGGRNIRENLFANLTYDFSQSCRNSLASAFPETLNPLASGSTKHGREVTRETINCVCRSDQKKWKTLCAEQEKPYEAPQ